MKLFLDDLRFPPEDKGWIVARTVEDAMVYVKTHGIPSFISFDHDLGCSFDIPEKSGFDFAKELCAYIMDNDLKIPDEFDYYVHSMNPIGSQNIKGYMENFLKHYRKTVI